MILMLMVSFFTFAATNKEKEDLYLKAATEKDMTVKLGLLKEYVEKYGQNDDKFLRFIYQSLADTCYRLKNYDDAIKYAEIAVGYEDIDQTSRLNLLFSLSNSYYITKKDLDKAYTYAEKILELTDKFIKQMETSNQDKAKVEQMVGVYKSSFIAPTYNLEAMILFAKDKDNVELIKRAAEKTLKAYEIDKSESTANRAFSLAGNLYQKNQFNDAIGILEQIVNKDHPKANEANLLASLYIKMKDKDKAIHYYELAYKAKPQSELAMKLGQLLHKTNPEKGARFFADAYVMNHEDKQTDAYKYLEQVYFLGIAKDKSAEEKEEGFKQMIEAAKARLGGGNN